MLPLPFGPTPQPAFSATPKECRRLQLRFYCCRPTRPATPKHNCASIHASACMLVNDISQSILLFTSPPARTQLPFATLGHLSSVCSSLSRCCRCFCRVASVTLCCGAAAERDLPSSTVVVACSASLLSVQLPLPLLPISLLPLQSPALKRCPRSLCTAVQDVVQL